MTETMPTALTTVFSRTNKRLAVITPQVKAVEWVLNRVGKADLELPWTNTRCTTEILRAGNRVMIEFVGVSLPAWTGVMDLPRSRSLGKAGITCYSGEYLLTHRYTDTNEQYVAAQSGAIFRGLIEGAGARWGLGLNVADDVFMGGASRTREYHYHELLGRIQELARTCGCDFAILGQGSAAAVTFTAHWYDRRGADKRSSVHLIDGQNVTECKLDEQGRIANHITIVGEGNTWDEDRPIATAESKASQKLYGYRQYVEVKSDIGDDSTLQGIADALLEKMAWPRSRATIQAADKPPGLFHAYDVGDIVHAKLFVENEAWHVEGPVRILGRQWNATKNTCRLEVEEWAY